MVALVVPVASGGACGAACDTVARVSARELMQLSSLSIGARFATESGRTGTLLKCNECRARVRWDVSERHVQATRADGSVTEFDVPGRAMDIAPSTQVRQIAQPTNEDASV